MKPAGEIASKMCYKICMILKISPTRTLLEKLGIAPKEDCRC